MNACENCARFSKCQKKKDAVCRNYKENRDLRFVTPEEYATRVGGEVIYVDGDSLDHRIGENGFETTIRRYHFPCVRTLVRGNYIYECEDARRMNGATAPALKPQERLSDDWAGVELDTFSGYNNGAI